MALVVSRLGPAESRLRHHYARTSSEIRSRHGNRDGRRDRDRGSGHASRGFRQHQCLRPLDAERSVNTCSEIDRPSR